MIRTTPVKSLPHFLLQCHSGPYFLIALQAVRKVTLEITQKTRYTQIHVLTRMFQAIARDGTPGCIQCSALSNRRGNYHASTTKYTEHRLPTRRILRVNTVDAVDPSETNNLLITCVSLRLLRLTGSGYHWPPQAEHDASPLAELRSKVRISNAELRAHLESGSSGSI